MRTITEVALEILSDMEFSEAEFLQIHEKFKIFLESKEIYPKLIPIAENASGNSDLKEVITHLSKRISSRIFRAL